MIRRNHVRRGCSRPRRITEGHPGGSAGLKQPSLCSMNSQTLGRRNAAPVQSTELDLSSHMHDYDAKERMFCTLTARALQGVTRFFADSGQTNAPSPPIVDSKKHDASMRSVGRAAPQTTRQPALEIRKTSTTRPGTSKALWPAHRIVPSAVRRNHVRRGCPRTAGRPRAISGGSAGLKQPSLCSMNGQTLGRRNAAPVQSTELDLSSRITTLELLHAERSSSTR